MPSSSAIWRIGLSFASCAIARSEGTGRRNLSLLGTNARLPLPAATFLTATLRAAGLFAAVLGLPFRRTDDFATFRFALTAIFCSFVLEFRSIMENFHKFDKGFPSRVSAYS